MEKKSERGKAMSELKKRIEQNRRNGAKGGERTAKVLTATEKENRAALGGQTCLMRYGRAFYRNIRAMRVA